MTKSNSIDNIADYNRGANIYMSPNLWTKAIPQIPLQTLFCNIGANMYASSYQWQKSDSIDTIADYIH